MKYTTMYDDREWMLARFNWQIDRRYLWNYPIHKSFVNRRIVSRLVRVISTSRRTVNPTIEHDVVRPDAHVSRRSYAAFTLLIREQFMSSQRIFNEKENNVMRTWHYSARLELSHMTLSSLLNLKTQMRL